MRFEVEKDIQAKGIEWLNRSPEIMEFLKKKRMKTVGEVVDRQKELPEKYWHEIKRKLIFNM